MLLPVLVSIRTCFSVCWLVLSTRIFRSDGAVVVVVIVAVVVVAHSSWSHPAQPSGQLAPHGQPNESQ